MRWIENVAIKNDGRCHLDKALYLQFQDNYKKTRKFSPKFQAIKKQLENETDFYQLNEYELAFLTGETINSIRDNRRSLYVRWPYLKDGDSTSKTKVTYPLKAIRNKLESVH